jgi:hypothetical protein
MNQTIILAVAFVAAIVSSSIYRAFGVEKCSGWLCISDGVFLLTFLAILYFSRKGFVKSRSDAGDEHKVN